MKGPCSTEMDDYVANKSNELKRLLTNSYYEKDFQKFFVENPSFLPGSRTPGGNSGHYPLHCALITQPELRGLKTKYPDFMWVATHSAGWFPTLIEIERPSKKIFKSDGVPTADFTQARNQLEQWRSWFNKPTNVQMFMDMYQIPDYMRSFRQMKLHMILIYGRRDEFNYNSNLSFDRLSLSQSDFDLMSFDRVFCDKNMRDAITVKLNENNEYEAVHFPEVIKIGPNNCDMYIDIIGVEKAIISNNNISDERKQFLINRIPYWKKWLSLKNRGIIYTSDFE